MSMIRYRVFLLAVSSCAPSPKPVEPRGHSPVAATASAPGPAAEKPAGPPAEVVAVDFASRPSVPNDLVVDASLAEWGPLVAEGAKQSSQIAVVVTPTGLVAAGELSARFASGVWLSVRLPESQVPPVGDYQRGGGVRELECDHEPFSDQPRTPEDKQACEAILARHAALVKEHNAAFYRSYRVDGRGVRAAMNEGLVAVAGAKAAMKTLGERVSFELSLPALALPRCGEVGLGAVSLAAAAGSAPPPNDPEREFALRLEPAVVFEPGKELWQLLFQRAQTTMLGPWIAYQPGRDDVVYVTNYAGNDRLTVNDDEDRPVTLGPKIGRAQLGYLFSGIDDVLLFVDGKPQYIVAANANKKAVTRDGKLHLLSYSEYLDEASAQPVVDWSVTVISADGTAETVELEPANAVWAGELRAYHDPSWSTFGMRGKEMQTQQRLDIEWKWIPSEHAYRLVKPKP